MAHLELLCNEFNTHYVFEWDLSQGLLEVELRTSLRPEDEHICSRQLAVAFNHMTFRGVGFYQSGFVHHVSHWRGN